MNKTFTGKTLFCSKKPPKTGDNENVLTHHQRKHVELLKLHLFADCEDHKWAMEVSADDKAYVRPETYKKATCYIKTLFKPGQSVQTLPECPNNYFTCLSECNVETRRAITLYILFYSERTHLNVDIQT